MAGVPRLSDQLRLHRRDLGRSRRDDEVDADADGIAYGIDLLMLLFVAILPFSTNLMVTHLEGPDTTAAVMIYGVNLLLASGTLSLLMFYIASERSLVRGDVADATLQAKVRQRWFAIGLNIVAIATAIVLPLAAVVLYLVVTIVGLVQPLVRLGRRGQGDAASEG